MAPDEIGRLPVRPRPEPEQQAARDCTAHNGQQAELDIADAHLCHGKPCNDRIKNAQRIKRANWDDDEFTQQMQERVGQNIACECPQHKEQEHTFPECNDRAGPEKRPRDLFPDRRKTIGKQRQQERQKHQDKAPRLGQDRHRGRIR